MYRLLFLSSLWVLVLVPTTWGFCPPQPRHYQNDGHRRPSTTTTTTTLTIITRPHHDSAEQETLASKESLVVVARRNVNSGAVAATAMTLLATMLTTILVVTTVFPWPAHAELTYQDLNTIKEMVLSSESRVAGQIQYDFDITNARLQIFSNMYVALTFLIAFWIFGWLDEKFDRLYRDNGQILQEIDKKNRPFRGILEKPNDGVILLVVYIVFIYSVLSVREYF